LGGLLLSSTIEAKQQKMTMSVDLGSSSSFALEEKIQKTTMSLLVHCHLLHLRKKTKKR
jgi:hypothetical protein